MGEWKAAMLITRPPTCKGENEEAGEITLEAPKRVAILAGPSRPPKSDLNYFLFKIQNLTIRIWIYSTNLRLSSSFSSCSLKLSSLFTFFPLVSCLEATTYFPIPCRTASCNLAFSLLYGLGWVEREQEH